MNHFNLMLQKRLKNEEEEELDEEDKGKGKKGSKNRKSKGWKIQIFFCVIMVTWSYLFGLF